jgi:hypothetical protein
VVDALRAIAGNGFVNEVAEVLDGSNARFAWGGHGAAVGSRGRLDRLPDIASRARRARGRLVEGLADEAFQKMAITCGVMPRSNLEPFGSGSGVAGVAEICRRFAQKLALEAGDLFVVEAVLDGLA